MQRLDASVSGPDTEPLRRNVPLRGILTQRSLEPPANIAEVQLRAMKFHPLVFKKMVRVVGGDPQPGDLVRVRDKRNTVYGYGLYNPRSTIALRMLSLGEKPPAEEWWKECLRRAHGLRRSILKLDEVTSACRLVHSEADGLPGLVVDWFSDTLSIEVFSLSMFQRIESILKLLCDLCGASHWRVAADPSVQSLEGFRSSTLMSPRMPGRVQVEEHQLKFEVDLEEGHKTGFFCDQRDNRLRFAQMCRGEVLDLCCYSGGFAIHASRLGKAQKVTAVDLDEDALAVARRNAGINKARIDFVHADAFEILRDLIRQKRSFDSVVLDPPKLIRSREEVARGRTKYFDLNRLAMQVVRPGGLLLTCSCSGLLQEEEFVRIVHAASWQPPLAEGPGTSTVPLHRPDGPGSPRPEGATSAGAPRRTLQILARTGAAPDHPISPDCPETQYLKALWLRVS